MNFFKLFTKKIVHQIIGFLAANPLLQNFFNGKLYQGPLKKICLPILNCYSCPAAVTACPIGSFQHMLIYFKYNFSFWIIGILGTAGITSGRWFCGHICPFGFFQDLLNKLSKINLHIPNFIKYFKYVILFGFVILLPLLTQKTTFCSYICPAGTLQAGLTLVWFNDFYLGILYYWKLIVLFLFTSASIFIHRPFCNTTCPLGLLLGFFNKISFFSIKVIENKCIKCDKCYDICPSDIQIYKNDKSIECVRCYDCINVCPTNAIEKENNFIIKEKGAFDVK